ncbi:MAG: hypothetical protein KBD76_05525 [Bacteriovorax sp.]|nr:hypothetical protein [Bacteriovorax sp.]
MGKKTYLILFIIFYSLSAGAFNSEWILATNEENVKVWLRKGNSEVTGSVEKRTRQTLTNWSTIKNGSYFKKYEAQKQKMLSLIGVTHWQTTQSTWKKSKSYFFLSIEGSYTDSSQQDIVFIEEHFYFPTQTIQLLHTRPRTLIEGDKLGKEILNEMKKEVGIKSE